MAPKDVLIADIDMNFCKSIENSLKGNGLRADFSYSVSETLNLFAKNMYSLLAIDICLPNISDGLGLIRIAKQIRTTPILALSKDLASRERESVFRAGADAHMVKPVDMEVCIAQMRSLIEHYRVVGTYIHTQDIIAFGTDLVVLPQYRQLLIHGNPLHLTKTEFNILYLLVRSPRQVFSLEQIHNHLWSGEVSVGGDDAIRAHIKRLKRKLASTKRDCIQNVWGIGYRFVPIETKK